MQWPNTHEGARPCHNGEYKLYKFSLFSREKLKYSFQLFCSDKRSLSDIFRFTGGTLWKRLASLIVPNILWTGHWSHLFTNRQLSRSRNFLKKYFPTIRRVHFPPVLLISEGTVLLLTSYLLIYEISPRVFLWLALLKMKRKSRGTLHFPNTYVYSMTKHSCISSYLTS